MALDYTAAFANLTAGNFSGAVRLTYETPLGNFAWIAVIFTTLAMVYIKTQNAGTTMIVGLMWLFFYSTYIGVVGNFLFWGIFALCLTVALVQFWGR